MAKQNYKIIYTEKLVGAPKEHEKHAAGIIANYFKTDVIFLRHGDFSSPDLEIGNTIWEIKSPMGNGKKTIENNLRAAGHQSHNVILDLSRCKLHSTRAMSRIEEYLKKDQKRSIKRLIIITKQKKVLEKL